MSSLVSLRSSACLRPSSTPQRPTRNIRGVAARAVAVEAPRASTATALPQQQPQQQPDTALEPVVTLGNLSLVGGRLAML